jgi:hypothetical protein
MIAREDFNTLPKIEQVTELFNSGEEICSRIYNNAIIKLYSLSNYFVEIWYSPSKNIISQITVVDLDDVIHLYENKINLPDLFEI